jgi:predicted nucleic acid-binding Zn ribbon protein
MTKHRTCPACGAPFARKSAAQKYCSSKCAVETKAGAGSNRPSRAALALFLLVERPRHGLFIHPHEKRKAGNDPSGIRLRVPRGRA